MDNNLNQFEQDAEQPQAAPALSDGKGFSIAALVLGILGIVGAFIPIVTYFTLVLAILGLIFGALGRSKSFKAKGKTSGMATAGLVLGIIGTAFGVLGFICTLACIGTAAGCAGAFMA